jgi:hypothetical protein
MSADQRYCLECGERHVAVSDFLRSGLPTADAPPSVPPSVPPTVGAQGGASARNNTLTVIAGVGVLLLAMGVGVLIGRSGGSTRQSVPPAQVVTIGSTAGSSSSGEESFSDDWPSGTKGFSVQLQTLPQSGTAVSAVAQAKTAAGAKGAASVGALKSEDFPSLTAGSYVIYSGVFHKRAEAQHALAGLKKNFPGAKVIEVSEQASGATSGSGASKASGGTGGSIDKPAPPSVLEGESHAKGKSYEEKSKNLPDVVSTG